MDMEPPGRRRGEKITWMDVVNRDLQNGGTEKEYGGWGAIQVLRNATGKQTQAACRSILVNN